MATHAPGERRKASYENVSADLGGREIFSAITNTYSLETELVNAGNEDVMKQVYLKLHPRSQDKWDAAVGQTGDARAVAVQSLFDDTRKGDFAQLLTEAIHSATSFNVPGYIRDAIEAIVQ